jgi:hypothetical protein
MLTSTNTQNRARLFVALLATLIGLMGVATLLLGPSRRAAAQAGAASWSYTGNLNLIFGRYGHTATLLPNGQVLVAAGALAIDIGGPFITNTAELYDPATGAWTNTGNLATPRKFHTATLLPNGKVLVAGGNDGNSPLNSAELYDPTTGTWSSTPNLNAPVHTATLLSNGKVLVLEGYADADGHITSSAELYEPATGTWTSTGAPKSARSFHTAILLPNGKVLVLGNNVDAIGFDTDFAELFDPATGTWSIASSLGRWHWDYTATLLPNGKVLVAGGRALSCGELCDDAPTNSALLYDPATEKWTSTGNLNTVREGHTATLLSSGNVLVVGGSDPGNRAELYDPATGTWSITASLNTARSGYSATLLLNGKVLVAAGISGSGFENTAELYDPGTTAGPSTVQFNSSSYTVTEGSPRVDITLSRSGDTARSASVSFATNDGAGLQDCNVKNGIASPRCDYINTLGTFSFAAGETAKSFAVAIVDDSYTEGNETFTVSLNNPNGSTLGAQSTATVTITDNDSSKSANPIDSTNFFVRQQYIDFLGREPDPGGFNGWVSTINNCSGDTTQCDRTHVSQQFFQSEEFQSRGYFVYRFYPVSFGRKPDYAEFIPDLARVSGFLDANQLEAAKAQFIADFMARPGFASQYNSLSNAAYVDALINTAAVNLPNRQSMIDSLNNNTVTRAQVLRQIVESAEISTKYNHQAFAVMEYFGYLRRQPDAFYLNWIQVLDQSNDPRGMVTGFVTSTEYRQRFGP